MFMFQCYFTSTESVWTTRDGTVVVLLVCELWESCCVIGIRVLGRCCVIGIRVLGQLLCH